MDFELKFKSIAVRWFLEVFLIVLAVVTIAAVAFSLFLNTLYTERVETAGNDYAYEFSSLSGSNKRNFADNAVKLSLWPFLCLVVSNLYCKAIKSIKVVAGNNGTCG